MFVGDILVVESDATSGAELVTALLHLAESKERVIRTFPSAEAALAWCDEADMPPALIVSGAELSQGMSGIALCRVLRAKESPCKNIPVVIVTGASDRSACFFEAIAAGATGFLPKPVDRKTLLSVASDCIRVFSARLQSLAIFDQLASREGATCGSLGSITGMV